MRDKYTAQASTTEEAIQKGLDALGIKRDNAEIEISQASKKGFLGFGQKDAIVVVTKKDAKNAIDELVSKEAVIGKSVSSDKDQTKDTETKSVSQDSPKVAKSTVKEPKEKTETQEKKSEPEEKKKEKKDKAPTKVKPVKKENEQDKQAIQKVADYLERIALKMGVDDISISVSRKNQRVLYSIDTKDAGLIIGRHGKVLNSLQTLAQIQMHQEADNKLYARVDAENYRSRRRKTVEQLAVRTAEKVKRTNRPVILEPMPAHERKQIHRYLNRYGGVETHSEGNEPHRYLVVEPSKEDELNL